LIPSISSLREKNHIWKENCQTYRSLLIPFEFNYMMNQTGRWRFFSDSVERLSRPLGSINWRLLTTIGKWRRWTTSLFDACSRGTSSLQYQKSKAVKKKQQKEKDQLDWIASPTLFLVHHFLSSGKKTIFPPFKRDEEG